MGWVVYVLAQLALSIYGSVFAETQAGAIDVLTKAR